MSEVATLYGIRSIRASCISAFLVGGTSILILRWLKYQRLQSKIRQKKMKEDDVIDKCLKQLHDKEQDAAIILEKDAKEIILALQRGELDLQSVLDAFLLKACAVTKKYNCVTSVMSSAEKNLKTLEQANASEMPLFGLPVSLKESFKTQGMDSTIGLSQYIGKPELEDAVLVKVLRHCGAVPFVKTNLPQLMLSFSSCNPIYGETSNPHKLGFTPGGSSAGEGSLIGAGGSLLGFGTDIAGSIRQPAHMCGICGFKPTMNRLSKQGLQGSLPGQTLISATLGPMARDVETLVLAMKTLLCPTMFKLDPSVPPMLFNTEVYTTKRKLCIGFYTDDGYNKPIPAVQRAVKKAKQALELAGHKLIPFQVPKIDEAMRIFTAAVYGDGGKMTLNRLKGEVEEPRLKSLYRKWRMPSVFRWIITFYLSLKSPRIAKDFLLHGGESCTVDRLWKLECEAAKYKKDFFDLWESKEVELDGIICPPFPVVAGPYKHFENMTALMSYTALYNLVNCPAGVLPVTKVTQADIDQLHDFSGHYGDAWDANVKDACRQSVGMPVGVQCVAKPWQDEMCLKIMREIELGLGNI
uniref:Fatty-acid amide hydrolase 1 n=1 Tax=Phallusia mammillata TaxID=59560 RepID=A0A6F9DCX1_9ASCI|nr:fatty-acid amide hydrolase 1-like [Phallusia mammillata]